MTGKSSVAEDYLKALYGAEERGADGVGVTDLAKTMEVAASTASENVRKLQQQGLVNHAPYQRAHLTEKGRDVAVSIIRRHRILETYLHDRLGFAWDEVHREAEILEHAVSELLVDRMSEALGHPTRDPHGDPIPTRGKLELPPTRRRLLEVPVGEEVSVERISDADGALLRFLDAQGLVLDARVTVKERHEYAGTSDLYVVPPGGWHGDGQERTFTLGERAVEAIWVSAAQP